MSALAMLPGAKKVNPDFIYIKDAFTAREHGFAQGERVRVIFQTIDKADTNGFDIWVYSKKQNNAKPISLIPAQYSLEPLQAAS